MFAESTTLAICGNWVGLTTDVLSCPIDHVFVTYFDLALENCCSSVTLNGRAVRADEDNKLSHLERNERIRVYQTWTYREGAAWLDDKIVITELTVESMSYRIIITLFSLDLNNFAVACISRMIISKSWYALLFIFNPSTKSIFLYNICYMLWLEESMDFRKAQSVSLVSTWDYENPNRVKPSRVHSHPGRDEYEKYHRHRREYKSTTTSESRE